MFDDKIQLGKGRRRVIDIAHIEGIFIERRDGWPFMHMDILDFQFFSSFQVSIGPWIAEFPPFAFTFPICGIKLYASPLVFLDVLFQLLEARFTVARIPPSVGDNAIRMLLSKFLVSLYIREAIVIKVAQILWIENRYVDIAVSENIFLEICVRIFLILVERPDVLLWAQVMVVVEAIDELFAVNIFLVLCTSIPQMDVGIDNTYSFSGFGRDHNVV